MKPAFINEKATVSCSTCRKINRANAKFCAHCGSSVVLNMTLKVCSACQGGNRLDAKHCRGCGHHFRTFISPDTKRPPKPTPPPPQPSSSLRRPFYVAALTVVLGLLISSILLATLSREENKTSLSRLTPTIEPVVAFPTALPQSAFNPTPIVTELQPTPTHSSPATSEPISSEALNRALLATVQILVPGDDGQESSSGSGSILTSKGYILTNYHVIIDPASGQLYNQLGHIWIATSEADLKEPAQVKYLAKVVDYNQPLDLALLKITSTKSGEALPENLNLTTLPIGNSEYVEIGQELSIIGFPGLGGDSVTFTKGTVAGFITNDSWVKTDAEINFGNSGGAAINQAGELVGVPSAAAGETVNLPGKIGLVRPINLAQPLIQRAFTEGN